jgi:hypothetical protein
LPWIDGELACRSQECENMMKTLRATLAAAAISVVALVPGFAATVSVIDSSSQGATNDAGINYAVGFGANTPIGATWSADPTFTPPPGNGAGQSQSPFNSNPLTNTNDYFVVGGGVTQQGGQNSPVTLTYAAVQGAFSMLWGSIDTYNTIEFLLGGSSVFTLSGTQLMALVDPLAVPNSIGNYERVAQVSFSNFVNGFDQVRFFATGIAFEFALPQVPVPAGGLLLLGALGGLAALRRHKVI